MKRFSRAVILASVFAGGLAAAAGEYNGEFSRRQARPAQPVARLIIGLRSEAAAARSRASGVERMQALAQRSGLHFRSQRAISPSLQVVELETALSGADLEDTLARLASDPSVSFAEPDARAYRHAVAGDDLFPGQWYLQADETSAINAAAAWDVTTGATGTVVAVLDTGVRFDHPDLQQAGRGGRLLPGYDFVGPDPGGGFRVANDGDGRDANPADPGDWVSANNAQSALFAGCGVSSSSWHGTRVSGMIGAIANNGIGIAGATWGTWILPVRVLGKCFGENSDILDGMRWAAGLHVEGVPDNPYPATILNMSLGAPGECTLGYLDVLDELAAAGVLVVASAGNSDGPVEYPGNCPGVAGVTGLRHIGTKVKYSSFGAEVALAAPGGNCVNTAPGSPCLFSLDTTVDSGATLAVASTYTDQFDYNVGTSFSAPSVAAIAALMQSVNGNLRAPQLISRLKEGARPFPPPPDGIVACQVGVSSSLEGCGCTTGTCGAGMADAPASVTAAQRPIAAIAVPGSVSPGQDVVLSASGSAGACGRSIVSYSWAPVIGAPTIGGTDTATATVVAPASGSFTVRVTVVDDLGAQDTADVRVTSSTATTEAPANAGPDACAAPIVPEDPGPFVDDGPVPVAQTGSGGGGGASGLAGVLLLGLALGIRRAAHRMAVNRASSNRKNASACSPCPVTRRMRSSAGSVQPAL